MSIPRGGHEKLKVYQLSDDLWIRLIEWAQRVRWGRQGYLASQLLRAAHSVPSNIAEGQARGTNKDFIHFLKIAQGSSKEVKHNLAGLRKLGILGGDFGKNVTKQAIAVDCMLTKLLRYRQGLEESNSHEPRRAKPSAPRDPLDPPS